MPPHWNEAMMQKEILVHFLSWLQTFLPLLTSLVHLASSQGSTPTCVLLYSGFSCGLLLVVVVVGGASLVVQELPFLTANYPVLFIMYILVVVLAVCSVRFGRCGILQITVMPLSRADPSALVPQTATLSIFPLVLPTVLGPAHGGQCPLLSLGWLDPCWLET